MAPEENRSKLANSIALAVWLPGGAVAFLPMAFGTSPWDAVTLRVPGNQGNWWHFLAGAPFFLAFPMIWLRLRGSASARGLRLLWIAVGLSLLGTTLVETPFLLHLAGTSDWQRLAILGLGFGILIGSISILILRRGVLPPVRACLAGIDAAYLANASLCLVVYGQAPGTIWSRSGWFVLMAIVWPIALDLLRLLAESLRTGNAMSPPQIA